MLHYIALHYIALTSTFCLPFPPTSSKYLRVSITSTAHKVLCRQMPGGRLWLGCHGDLLAAEEIAVLFTCYLYST